MTSETMFIFFMSMLLMWIKPGPAQLLKIATTLDKGLPYGIAFSLGGALMCSVFFVAAALGYKVLSDIFNYTGFFLQIFGAVYLTYISIKGFIKFYKSRNGSGAEPIRRRKTDKGRNVVSCFIIGILAVLSSPFWVFYFIGILPILIPLEGMTINSYFIGAFLVFLSGVIVDWPMLTLISQLQKTFMAGALKRYVNVSVSAVFLIIAGFLFYSAFFAQDFSFNIFKVL